MTLLDWIRSKVLGAADPSLTAEVVDEIEREKSKLNGARDALLQQVDAIKAHRKRGAAIFEILDDALRTVDRGSQR